MSVWVPVEASKATKVSGDRRVILAEGAGHGELRRATAESGDVDVVVAALVARVDDVAAVRVRPDLIRAAGGRDADVFPGDGRAADRGVAPVWSGGRGGRRDLGGGAGADRVLEDRAT